MNTQTRVISFRRHPLRLALGLALSLIASTSWAAPWAYRGSLQDSGKPAQGRYDIRLTLLDASASKHITSPITFFDVAVVNGQFALDVDFGVDLSQAPAMKLMTEVAQGGSGFTSIGAPTNFDPKAVLAGICWDTTGNTGNVDGTNFIGNTDNVALELRTANKRVALFSRPGSSSNNVLLGGAANNITEGASGASILGGGEDSAGTTLENIIYDDYSVIGGGRNNTAGSSDGTPTNARFTTVSGGSNNNATFNSATVAGGSGNLASGSSQGYSTVSGGDSNQADADFSTVPGGRDNLASGDYSFAAGRRAIVRSAAATGETLAVCTALNTCGDEGTFIWADAQNANFFSSGPNQFLIRSDGGVGINGTPASAGLELNVFGTTPFDGFVEVGLIPKPSLNGNTGERVEFGVGKGGVGTNDADLRIAHRNDAGTFFEHLSIDGDGSVIVRSNPANILQGVQLAIGAGAWSSLSDRRLKTDITAINPLAVLDKLAAMPVLQWRYIGQPGMVQHLGPMAQDFAAAFGLGENDTTISTVDADGVALAAIQGLNQKLEQENAELRAQLEAVLARVSALEAKTE